MKYLPKCNSRKLFALSRCCLQKKKKKKKNLVIRIIVFFILLQKYTIKKKVKTVNNPKKTKPGFRFS